MTTEYDRYITGGRYRKAPETVYCHTPECLDRGEPQEVTYESEYGAGWYTPEECPACGGEWHEDAPDERMNP